MPSHFNPRQPTHINPATMMPVLTSVEPDTIGPLGGALLRLRGFVNTRNVASVDVGGVDCPMHIDRSDLRGGSFVTCEAPAAPTVDGVWERRKYNVTLTDIAGHTVGCASCSLTYRSDFRVSAVNTSAMRGSPGEWLSFSTVGDWPLFIRPQVQLRASMGDGVHWRPAVATVGDGDGKPLLHVEIPDMPPGVHVLKLSAERSAIHESTAHGRVELPWPSVHVLPSTSLPLAPLPVTPLPPPSEEDWRAAAAAGKAMVNPIALRERRRLTEVLWSSLSYSVNDDVTVPAGQTWLLDASASVRSLTVYGTVRWAINADNLQLQSGFIHVRDGGAFELGTAAAPMLLRARIVLVANGAAHPYLGQQFLAGEAGTRPSSISSAAFNNISNGESLPVEVPRIDIHGRRLARTWTLLARSVCPPSNAEPYCAG